MFWKRLPVNPHRQIDAFKLTEVTDRTLRDLITLYESAAVPPCQLHLAGVPSLATLEAESVRRANARQVAA
jgi:hypothetical protein